MIRSSVRTFVLLAAVLSACGGVTAGAPSGDAGDVGDSEGERSMGSTASGGGANSRGTGGSVSAAGMGGSATVEEACAAEATALCDLRDECTDGFANQITYGSAALCVTQRTASCVAGMNAPDIANDIAAIQACTAAYPSETCSDWWDENTSDVCRSRAGARTNGAACGVNSQCASGFCGAAFDEACGTCQPPPAPGAPCVSSSTCGYDLSCPIVQPATSGVCTVRQPIGGGCDGYHLCQGELTCIGANTAESVMGTCETGQTTVGAACDDETGPGCDGELYLFCSSGTCEREALVSAGKLCGHLGSTADIQCESGAACVKPSGSLLGTCVAPAANGAACDSLAGPPCLSPAKCITSGGATAGTCVFPDPASCG